MYVVYALKRQGHTLYGFGGCSLSLCQYSCQGSKIWGL
jgi:hypothetical protein